MKRSAIIAPAIAGTLVLVVVAGLIVTSSYAVRLRTTPPPTAIIATMDFERVFDEVDRRADAEFKLDKLDEELRDRMETFREMADRLKQDLALLVPGTEQYQKTEKDYKQTVLDFRAMVEFRKAKLDAARARARVEIRQQIVKSAATYAAANGIAFIIANDSETDFTQGTDRQIVQQMLLQRIIYASPECDITDDLIAWINER
ncbi:MAG: OmpH family outer membrane protein [Phycisphaerales bacterium]